jgi:hypothetical protein
MKQKWSLPVLMHGLHEKVAQDLKIARSALAHPTAKGDGSEAVWISLFEKYLPKRYAIGKATVVDSFGNFSEQMDVVIFDRQYTPLIFEHKEQIVIPSEAVYVAFEAKQDISKANIRYAQRKVASVRKLHRTSAEVQTIDGRRIAEPQRILGGFLAFENGWRKSPDLSLKKALAADQGDGRLDFGCVAAYGTFGCEGADCLSPSPHARATTCFLLEIITRLQLMGTAPAIDMTAYARWLVAG